MLLLLFVVLDMDLGRLAYNLHTLFFVIPPHHHHHHHHHRSHYYYHSLPTLLLWKKILVKSRVNIN